MNGKVYIIVGARGSGKSTIIKNLIKNVDKDRLFCYDVQTEYGLGDFESLPDIDDFLTLMLPAKNSVIIYEEATAFFSNRGSNKAMRKHLIDARHRNNQIFLVFHSIRSIPLYIYDLSDYVYVLQTRDKFSFVESKHEVLLNAFKEVMNKPRTKYPYINFEFVDLSKPLEQ